MMIAFWIIFSLFAYIFIATLSWNMAVSRAQSLYGNNHTPSNCYSEGGWCNHACADLWIRGIFWPFGLPVGLAKIIHTNFSPSERRERKHIKELADAKHLLELEAIRTKEAEEVHRQWLLHVERANEISTV